MINKKQNNLTTWSPMGTIMDDFMRLPDLWNDSIGSWGRNFPADMWEDDTSVHVKMPLAGVKPEDVDITIENGVLTIKGESREESEEGEKGKNYYQKQIRYGNFMQSFSLPSGIKADDTSAEFKDGMLMINVPKSEEAKPKQIKVSVQ